MRRIHFYIFGGLLFLVTAVSAVSAADRIYLAEYKYNDPKLYSMDLDGSNVKELGILPTADWLPVGLQIDRAAKQVYWTHGAFNQGAIRRAGLDGSGMQTILSGLTNPRGLALDVVGGKVYWSDTQDRKLYRANLNGTGTQAIVSTGHQLGHPRLDLTNGLVYYGNFDTNEIRRCNLDGTGDQMVLNSADNAAGIALDLASGKLYWVDAQTVTNYVARADLNGTNKEILVQFAKVSSGLVEIDLNLKTGKMYWADEITTSEKGVWEANLDGTGAKRIYASPSGYNSGAMLLDLDPSCVTPTVSYGSGCAGSGAFVPELTGSECAIIGSTYTLEVGKGLGGAQAFFFLGLATASWPMDGGCTFLLSPILPPILVLTLGGSGAGNGTTTLGATIPATAPPGAVATLQVFLIDPGAAAGYAATNGLIVTLQ